MIIGVTQTVEDRTVGIEQMNEAWLIVGTFGLR
jgi:hypothetical protein